MNRRSLSCNWTEEDQHTSAQWGRGMAVFYTCIALLVLGVIALTKPSSVAPNESRDRQTWAVGLEGEGTNRNADVSFAQAQSEAHGEGYPGRFVANCKPAGNSGCACDADPQNIHDQEYLRMIEWLLQTCSSLMQSETRLGDKAVSDVTIER